MAKPSQRSKEQAKNVMKLINRKRIKEFKTKSALYRVIECIKFPHTESFKVASNRDRKPVYGPQQYDVVLDYMKSMGWIREFASPRGKMSYRYSYAITRKGRAVGDSPVEYTPTRKEQVANFVRSLGGKARRWQIVKFLVDSKYGNGTYDRYPNYWRGYYGCAFSKYGGDYLYTGVHGLYRDDSGNYCVRHMDPENIFSFDICK